jgi:hypothetical protein
VRYEELNMFDSYFWFVAGALTLISSFVYRLIFKENPLIIGIFVTVGVVISVIFRIINDSIFLDSSSHSLASLEIGFAAIHSLPPAFLGAYLAYIFKKQR